MEHFYTSSNLAQGRMSTHGKFIFLELSMHMVHPYPRKYPSLGASLFIEYQDQWSAHQCSWRDLYYPWSTHAHATAIPMEHPYQWSCPTNWTPPPMEYSCLCFTPTNGVPLSMKHLCPWSAPSNGICTNTYTVSSHAH